MTGEASEALPLHAGGDGGAGAGAGVGGWESGSTWWSESSGIGTASSDSSSSLFSSTMSSVGDGEEDGDGATSSSSRPAADRRRHLSSLSSSSSSTSSESEASLMDGAAGGPLYGMSTMRDDLPPASSRTGLSMYYHGRSESFTSLFVVSCVEDLAKKTTPYIRRPKTSGRHAAALGVKNKLSKKAPSGRKPAASECLGKRELYRC